MVDIMQNLKQKSIQINYSFVIRLDILKPSQKEFLDFLDAMKTNLYQNKLLNDGVREFIGILRRKGVWVALISGGFLEFVQTWF